MRRDRSRGGEKLLPGPPPVGKGTGDKLSRGEKALSPGERKRLRPTPQARVELGVEGSPSQDNWENACQRLSLFLLTQ